MYRFYLASKQISLCSQCPIYSFQHRWRPPEHPSRHSCPVCWPWGSCPDEASPIIQIFSWQHNGSLEHNFLRDIFTRGWDGGNLSALSKNLFRFQGYFNFKLLEKFIFPGFMFCHGMQFFLRYFTHVPIISDSSSFPSASGIISPSISNSDFV